MSDLLNAAIDMYINIIRDAVTKNPIDMTDEVDDVKYAIHVCPERITCKSELSRLSYTLPVEISMTWGDRTFTFEWICHRKVFTRETLNVTTLLSNLEKYIHASVMGLPYKGITQQLRALSANEPWRDVYLHVYELLWDHPTVGKYLKDEIANKYVRMAYFETFPADLLGFIRMYTHTWPTFSYEVCEEDSIAFVAKDDSFTVYTNIDGIYRKNGIWNLNVVESDLHKRLELARTLMK